MPIQLPLNGFNGKVTVEIAEVETTIAGLSGFTLGEDARAVIDVPTTFETERDTVIIQQKGPITFSVEGFSLLGIDDGQDFIKDAYDDKTELTTIKFWLDETTYIAPVSGDFVRISGISETSTSADGFATWGFTGNFFDEYEQIITEPSV